MFTDPSYSVVSVWMITMMALDRFGAITSHSYMTKSSSGHYRIRVWIISLSVWLCAYFLTREMWLNTEYLDEIDVATCKMDWGLPIESEIPDFLRNEDGCHSCPIDGLPSDSCLENHVNHDQSPVIIKNLTELGWKNSSCWIWLSYYPNSSDYDDSIAMSHYSNDYGEMNNTFAETSTVRVYLDSEKI